MKKITNQKEGSKKCGVANECHKLGNELAALVKSAKNKYNKADDKTKKAVLAGIAGAIALMAATIGHRKIRGRKKRK